MTNKELEKLGFKPIKVGKGYYLFMIDPSIIIRKKKLYYGAYPVDVTTRKNLDIVEYISIGDIFTNKTQAIIKAKRNLIKKLKRRQ